MDAQEAKRLTEQALRIKKQNEDWILRIDKMIESAANEGKRSVQMTEFINVTWTTHADVYRDSRDTYYVIKHYLEQGFGVRFIINEARSRPFYMEEVPSTSVILHWEK